MVFALLSALCAGFATYSPRVNANDKVLETDEQEEGDAGGVDTALEPADFQSVAVVVATSNPRRARVRASNGDTCYTPCRLRLTKGTYTLKFEHTTREPKDVQISIVSEEQVQVHAVLGSPAPWKIIVPAYFVGTIFTAGGISAIAIHSPSQKNSRGLSPDEHRYNRNLGIASVAIGLPLLGLATYFALSGTPGEARTSVAPKSAAFELAPLTDQKGSLAGATLIINWL